MSEKDRPKGRIKHKFFPFAEVNFYRDGTVEIFLNPSDISGEDEDAKRINALGNKFKVKTEEGAAFRMISQVHTFRPIDVEVEDK